jgi:hypothetical protein
MEHGPASSSGTAPDEIAFDYELDLVLKGSNAEQPARQLAGRPRSKCYLETSVRQYIYLTRRGSCYPPRVP